MTEAALPGTGPGELFEIREEHVDGVRLRVFANAPPSLRSLWELSAVHGDATYLVYEDRRWTFKVPSTIRITPDELPPNAAGKVLKRELRQQLAGAPA